MKKGLLYWCFIGWWWELIKVLFKIGAKANNAKLQKAVTGNYTPRVQMNRSQLMGVAKVRVDSILRVVNESITILKTTTNPATFKSRVDLIEREFIEAEELMPYFPELTQARDDYYAQKPYFISLFENTKGKK